MKKYIFLLLLLGFLIPTGTAQAAGTPVFNGSTILYKETGCGTSYPISNVGATPAWTDGSLATSSAISNGGCAYGGFGTVKNIDGYLVRLTTGATDRNMVIRFFDETKNLISTINGTMKGSSTTTDITPTNAYFFTITNTHGSSTTVFEVQLYEAPDTTAPAAPVLSASGANMSINLSWTIPADIDITSYQIFRGSTLITTITGRSNNLYTVTGLAPQSYNHTIKAVDASGNLSVSSNTATATATDTTPPTTPTNLVTNAIDNGMSLTWFPSTDNHMVSGYQVFLNGVLNQTVTTTTATVTSLINGTSYNFSVKAVDASGNLSGSISKNATPADNVSPLLNSDITPGTITDDTIEINFAASPSSDNLFYHVTRNNFSTYTTINHTTATSYSNTFTGLSSGATYTIKVRAVDDDGNYSIAKSINLTTTTTAPVTPSGLSISELDNELILSWSANTETDLSGYKVYLIGTAAPIATITQPTTTFEHTGLSNGVSKSYQITAYDIHGNESFQTAVISGTPVDLFPPFDVGGISTTSFTEYTYTFSWDPSPSSDIESYKIYKNSSLVDTQPHTGAPNYTYTATDLTPGITYIYKVNPVDDDGNELTTGTVGTIDVATIGTAPGAPTGLNATPAIGEIELSWFPNTETDLEGYKIYKLSGGSYTLLETTDLTSYTFTTSLDSDFSFVVAAYDVGGTISSYSGVITAAAIPSTPPPPFAGMVTPISGSAIVESGVSIVGAIKWILLIVLALIFAARYINTSKKAIGTNGTKKETTEQTEKPEKPLTKREKEQKRNRVKQEREKAKKEKTRVTTLNRDLRKKMSKSLGYKIYK
jgi:chitodextrinase